MMALGVVVSSLAGACELATIPTPNSYCRMPESSTRKRMAEKWSAWQKVLALNASMYANAGKPALLLMGDSISEAFRGTAIGLRYPRTTGHEVPLQESSLMAADLFPSPPLILAISGDETQHLLWRLRDGAELSPSLAHDHRLFVNLLIGTNSERHGPTRAFLQQLSLLYSLLSGARLNPVSRRHRQP